VPTIAIIVLSVAAGIAAAFGLTCLLFASLWKGK